MEALKNFTLSDLYGKLSLPENEFENYLIELKLLHHHRVCECGGKMSRKGYAGRKHGTFRCTSRDCRKEKGFLVGTFFEGTHLTVKEVFQLAYFWSQNLTAEEFLQFQMKREDGTEISSATICDWKQFFRDICVEYLRRNTVQLGGPEKIVEIDETVISRRKYNRGRMVAEQRWFFAGVERGTNKVFFEEVEHRNAETLLPIIQKYILPGTTIMSDLWRAYFRINELPEGYRHLTVNHSTNFVDPETGACTNTIESYNQKFKARHKREYGTARSLLAQYMY
uniref:ISXO2-like transposase domain-containing protein n=1 Tax=Panagrolaimus davidi TaxID=227884 RepID=A0A914QF24_9BILA